MNLSISKISQSFHGVHEKWSMTGFVCLVKICICWNISKRYLVALLREQIKNLHVSIWEKFGIEKRSPLSFLVSMIIAIYANNTSQGSEWSYFFLIILDKWEQIISFLLEWKEAENCFRELWKHFKNQYVILFLSLTSHSPGFQVKISF